MGVSKVNFGNQTLIDLTSDTVTAESLAEGVTAHGADGEPIRGTGTLGSDKFYSIEDTASNSIDNADYIPFYDTSGTLKTKILFSALKALIDTDTKDWASITGKPTTFTPSSHTHVWADITDKPSTFTPASHSHAWSEITGKPSIIGTFASAPTSGQVVVTDGTTGGLKSSGYTIGKSVPSDAVFTDTKDWNSITGKPSTFTPAAHTHNNITSRGNVTCETTNTRPAVDGLSTSCAYNNGYPDTYGNVITIKGTGDTQLFLGWSGTSGAHAPVYVRSRRDTASANWSEWAKVYTSAFKPSKSDVGLGNVANYDQSKAIKAITRSGTTFTYTCLDGTTGTFTQQDNNTTYNFSGVTFYSGNKDNAEHNANNCLKNGHYYYTSNGPATSLGATTNDGALYVQSYSDIWVAQIAQDYRNGRLFVRALKEGAWQNWAAVYDTAHKPSWNDIGSKPGLYVRFQTGNWYYNVKIVSSTGSGQIIWLFTDTGYMIISTSGSSIGINQVNMTNVGNWTWSKSGLTLTLNCTDHTRFMILCNDNAIAVTFTDTSTPQSNTLANTWTRRSGDTLLGRLTTTKPIKPLITGTATAAQDKGSGVSPRYFPTKWTFNAGYDPTDGDCIVVKIPNGGHDYGVFVSTDNGSHYYPVCLNGADRLTTHFGSGQMIALIYDSAAVTNSVFPLAGGDARVNVTGSWRVINYRDTNTDIRPAAYCDTAAGTAAKVASWTNYNLLTNSYLLVTIVNTNTYAGALTLNINGKGAKTIVLNGSNTSSSNYNLTRGTYLVLYDGSKYHFRTDGFLPGYSIKNTNNQRLTPSYYMESTQTLSTSGTTTFTFSHSAITTNSLFDIYSSIWGVNPSSVTSAAGSLTVVFPKHTSAASLKVRVYMYWD